MSFSIDWLNLREPADARARSRDLIAKLGDWCAGRAVRVLDLGSGTGSSYRALAPHIGGHWTLSDIDPQLLAEATRRHGRELHFCGVQQVDLVSDLEQLITDSQPDVICGSALIDLTSANWLDRLAGALPANAAFYMALSYNGAECWSPQPPAEATAHAAFLSHQRGDKGFGPALGPDAAHYMADALHRQGRYTDQADSPWTLGPQDADLIVQLAAGSADAVAQTAALSKTECSAWAAGRKTARDVTVGHIDLLSIPGI